MKYFAKFLIFTFLFAEMLVSSEKINIFDFDDNDLTKFKSHSIKKKTNYSIIKENGESYLKAEAEGQASGLGREIKVDLDKTQIGRAHV